MTTRRPKAVEERYTITQVDANVVQANGVADVMSDIYKYTVPVGTTLVLMPDGKFRLYLEDSEGTPVEMIGADLVQIEVRDSPEQSREVIYGPAPYIMSKEFQDSRKMASLNLAEPIRVREGDKIVFMANATTGAGADLLDASDGRLALDVQRFRETLG